MSDKSIKVTKTSDGKPADQIIAGDKVNSPVVAKSKDGKPVKDEKTNKKSKSGLDDSFGLS